MIDHGVGELITAHTRWRHTVLFMWAGLLVPSTSSAIAAQSSGLVAPLVCSRSIAPQLSINRWHDSGAQRPAQEEDGQSIWDKGLSSSMSCQGGTLKTWKIVSPTVSHVELAIRSEERSPIDADCELWHTPSFKPIKFHVYSECGLTRPVNVVLDAAEHPKTIAVYNQGPLEFPFEAVIDGTEGGMTYASLSDVVPAETIQGGRITSQIFGGNVKSVQVLLKTEQNNMNAKIEVTQGPNQVKQSIEVYAFASNPFYAIIQTPGSTDSSIRIINQDSVEYPFDVSIAPYAIDDAPNTGPVMGGFMAY